MFKLSAAFAAAAAVASAVDIGSVVFSLI